MPLALQELLLGPLRGRLSSGERRRAKALAAVIHSERAIQMGVDLDAGPSIAASARPGAELEEATVELHGVVVLDGALVLETADAVEVCVGGSWPPGGCGVRRGLSEASIVAWEKPVEHALGLRECARLGETEFHDEAILKGAKEPLDATLRLRRLRTDPADAKFLEGAPDLGGCGAALELLGQRERGTGIAVKDSVAVSVRCRGEPITADEMAEEQEVAVGVLFQAEDAPEDPARRVIDGRVEHEPGAAFFEPGVMAAIHLDEEARLGHALAAPAMARRSAGAGAADPGRAEEALHRPTREPQALALSEQLGEVVIIHACVAGAGQREDPGPDLRGEAPGRGSAAVPMGERGEALVAQAGEEPTEVPQRETQELGGGPSLQGAVLNLGEQMYAVLLLLGQGNRLPGHCPRMTDSLAR